MQPMVEKKVMLAIQGVQSDPARGADESQLVTTGYLKICEGGCCLSYEENDEEDGHIETRIEMDGGIVRVNRSGPFQANFAFKKGCQCKSVFMTPVGKLEIEAFPTDVDYRIGETEGSVNLSYQLSMQGRYMGLNHIRINYWQNA